MENSESSNKNLFGEAIKTGVILAAVSIILTMLVYIMDVNLLADWKLGIGTLIIAFVIVVRFGKKFRDEELEGGFMPFGEAFKYSFSAFFISSLVSMVFMIVLYEVIDPELPSIITKKALQNTEAMMENFGAPADSIDETLEQVEKDMDGKFTAMGILSGSWVYIITSAFFGAIAGAIIKKKKPEFE